MALADVYDALISALVYKPAFSHEKAVEIIRTGRGRGRGRHFYPLIVNAFFDIEEEFRAIAAQFSDREAEAHHAPG